MTKTVIEMAREAGAMQLMSPTKHENLGLMGNEVIERFAAIIREDEREKLNHSGESTNMVQRVRCPDCNGSGEMETGIGMMVCDSCHGSCVKGSLTVQNHSGEAADMVQPVANPVCYLWVDPSTRNYIVDRCDHPTEELIPVYTTPPSVEAAIEATKAKYEKKFDEVFGELIEKINGGMSAAAAIRGMK